MKTRSGDAGRPARILLVKTHAIGDLLMTTAAIRDLRKARPDAHITLMTGRWSAPAVRGNPHLDAVIEFEDRILLDVARHPLAALRLLARIRGERFDEALVFHPSRALHAFVRLAGVAVRYGLTRDGRRGHLSAGVVEDLGPGTYYPVNFQRVAELAGAVPGSPVPEVFWSGEDEREAARLLAEGGIPPGTRYVLVAPGGARNVKEDVAARRWPARRFAELVRETGRSHPDVRFVVTGGPGDADDAAVVTTETNGVVDLVGKAPLAVLFALVRGAAAVVCNDSAVLHVAAACGRPAIVPFGPTGARQRVPEQALAHVVQSGLPCSPCYAGGRFPGCPIGIRCLREMPVDALRERLERVLDEAGA